MGVSCCFFVKSKDVDDNDDEEENGNLASDVK